MSFSSPIAFEENYAKESTAYDAEFVVSFPKTPNFELILIGAELHQAVEAHDVLVLRFKGKPKKEETTIVSGDPVQFTYRSGPNIATFEGYVYTIDPVTTTQAHSTTMTCVSASYVLKDSSQEIFQNVTADQVVSRICAKAGLTAVTQRHPRLRETIVQPGQTYWQVLKRLAKQTGFALRVENTTVFFMSKEKIFQDKKDKAQYFRYKDGITRAQRSTGTCLVFNPMVSDESVELGARIDRVITGASAASGDSISTTHSTKNFDKAVRGKVVPSEGYFDAI